MDYRVLGPLEVRADGRLLDLDGVARQRVLAALLLNANRTVDLPALVRAVWDGDPPATAERQVRNRISVLRGLLTRHGGLIDTDRAGYRLRVRPGELDAAVFDDLVARGRAAADPVPLRQALALWRGPVLDGLAGTALAAEAAALTERRLVAWEECLELELAAGRHAGLVPELRDLVDRHPTRERLVEQLMVALHRSGRRDGSVAAYRALADRLAEELGIDPSPRLREAYRAVLGAEPPAGAPVTPAQLPSDVFRFTGRIDDLDRLDRFLSDGQQSNAVIISAIAGTAGAGKTALAVHWAHRVRDKFPDGQLFVNLRGFAPTPPVRPIDALAGFLRALGVPANRVPAGVHEAAALYRDLLSDRRVLVVLDNASGAEQVRPLLPGGAGSLALVTSRDALAGLGAGACRISLDVLAPEEAELLLARVLGADRVAAEPHAAADFARLCAYLPLALRIAAANLSEGERLDRYAERLRGGDRLAALAVEGDELAAVRAAFDLSYAALPAPLRRLFRLLGLVPGPDVTADAAAALVDGTVADARAHLRRLAAAHLIEPHGPGRYAFHDLLRLYAGELVAAEPDRTAALDRLYDFYLYTVRAAVGQLVPVGSRLPAPDRRGERWQVPEFTDVAAALAWLDAERPNLVVAVTEAARHGPRPMAWLLADSLRPYFYQRVNPIEMIDVVHAALHAAELEDELRPQIAAHNLLGILYHEQDRSAEVIAHTTRALEIARGQGWADEQAAALRTLAIAHRHAGQLRLAAEYLTEALDLEPGFIGRGETSGSLGVVWWQLGELDRAHDAVQLSLDTAREIRTLRAQVALHTIAAGIDADRGRPDEARAHLADARAMADELGAQDGEAHALGVLADVERLAGNLDTAWELVEDALALARAVGASS